VEGILGRSCCAEGSGAASFGLPQMFPMADCAEREVNVERNAEAEAEEEDGWMTRIERVESGTGIRIGFVLLPAPGWTWYAMDI